MILDEAQFHSANLNGVNLSGATLVKVEGATQDMLDSAYAERDDLPRLVNSYCIAIGNELNGILIT